MPGFLRREGPPPVRVPDRGLAGRDWAGADDQARQAHYDAQHAEGD